MKIVVCFKIIPDESEIEICQDKTLDIKDASLVISPYDCNAIEAAMKLSAAIGDCPVVALTAGGDKVENGKMRKSALSRGPLELYAVKDGSLDSADCYVTASALKAGVEKLGGADLIICGEGSGDMYRQQTGSFLGALMGIPTVNAVSSISASGEGGVRVERTVEDGVEVFDVTLPAVLSVTSDICPTRIPSMKDILAAGKKPFSILPLADIAGIQENRVSSLSVLVPEQTDRRNLVIKGDSEENIQEFYNMISRTIR